MKQCGALFHPQYSQAASPEYPSHAEAQPPSAHAAFSAVSGTPSVSSVDKSSLLAPSLPSPTIVPSAAKY